MGRRRRQDTHLPKRMYERRGKFYFDSPVTKRWEPLGDDLGAALEKYGRFVGPWHGRTIGDTIDRYRTHVLPLKRSAETRKNEGASLTRLKAVFGAMRQDSVTHQHLYKYADERMDERPQFKGQPAPSSGRHEVSLLGHVFAKGIRWGAGTLNPVRTIEWDDEEEAAPRYVPDSEYDPVYALANDRMQATMNLARSIGQHRIELLRIKPKEHFTDEGILVRRGKTGREILIEWTDELRSIVARLEAFKPDIPKEYLVRKRNGRGYTPRGFSAIWQRLMRKAIDKGAITAAQRFRFSDLRRKAANEKGDDEEARKLLGHANVATTRKHYIANPKPIRARPVR